MVVRPCMVSCMVTVIWSPGRMKSTSGLVGLPLVAGLNCSGFGAPMGLPEWVRNAKLTYSIPPRIELWQDLFRFRPLIGSSDNLSIVSAAHQLCASQLWLANCFTQPGG